MLLVTCVCEALVILSCDSRSLLASKATGAALVEGADDHVGPAIRAVMIEGTKWCTQKTGVEVRRLDKGGVKVLSKERLIYESFRRTRSR
jgi:hypothetical protein